MITALIATLITTAILAPICYSIDIYFGTHPMSFDYWVWIIMISSFSGVMAIEIMKFASKLKSLFKG